MQPVYIQRIASIHPQGNHSQENNPKVNDSPDVAANRPFLQACEPDYKDIIANATLRRRMSRIVKMGVACGLEFAMKRPEEGWGITISKFEKLVNRENNKLRAEFTARINNNTLSPTMASVVHYHILWKRISEKMGWNYTKAKTR